MKKINTILKSVFIILLFISVYFYWPKYVVAGDCSQVTPGGSFTITSSCMFSGTVNGVDNGSGNTNNAVLTVATGGTLTVGATQKLSVGSLSLNGGGPVVLMDGGSIRFGSPIWMTDTDSDGVPDSLTQIASSSAPLNARRRSAMATITTTDTNPTSSCPDGTKPASSCQKCFAGGAINENDGEDLFHECASLNACNGAGACTFHAKRVFISSQSFRGNLNGIAGADTVCQNDANSAGLGGTWLAWISSQTASAGGRLTHSSLPYSLVDQVTKIADNWTSLTSGSLSASINKDQSGNIIVGSNGVWTNTNADGSIVATTSNTTCNNWGSVGGSNNGTYGLNEQFNNAGWTNAGSAACNNVSRNLYCFEQ